MGLFNKKTEEEKQIEQQIKEILGGFGLNSEVKNLFEKYDLGITTETTYIRDQVKQEARDAKIQPNEYLSRLEGLLSDLSVNKKDEENAKREADQKAKRIQQENERINKEAKQRLIEEELKRKETRREIEAKQREYDEKVKQKKAKGEARKKELKAKQKARERKAKERVKEEERGRKQKAKLLFHEEMSNITLKQKIHEDQNNLAMQEAGSGWANLANTLSFNSYQQMMSWTQKAMIDQNKSLIRQVELQRRETEILIDELHELKDINKKILDVLENLRQ